MKKRVSVLFLLLIFVLSGCAADLSQTTIAQTTQPQTVQTQAAVTTQEVTTSQAVAVTESMTEIITESETKSAAVLYTTDESVTSAPVTAKQTTEAVTTPVTEKSADVCYLTISCLELLDNMDKLEESKRQFVPQSGYILKHLEVELKDGDTAFSVLTRAAKENSCYENCKYCQKNGIQLEYSFTPAYNSYYVEGIHQLYQMDCGSMSGWLFSVNGVFPDVASSEYGINPNDEIEFIFTVNGDL